MSPLDYYFGEISNRRDYNPICAAVWLKTKQNKTGCLYQRKRGKQGGSGETLTEGGGVWLREAEVVGGGVEGLEGEPRRGDPGEEKTQADLAL